MPIPPDDVCLNKASIIERALRRVREEYSCDPGLTDYTHIDAMTLNIERACQAAIDLAMHVVARDRLGMPQTSPGAQFYPAHTIRPPAIRADMGLHQNGLRAGTQDDEVAGMRGAGALGKKNDFHRSIQNHIGFYFDYVTICENPAVQ